MSGLLFLQSDDFSIQKGQKGDILCNSIRGISLILFYSPSCPFCQNLIPVFKRLPGQLGGVHFGMINVSNEPEVIKMSKYTISPIKYVPLIILFINGKPFIRYETEKLPTEEEIKNFIIDVVGKIQTKEKFHENEKKTDKKIPGFSIGYPLIGFDDDAYLDFQEAYVVLKK